MVIIHAIGIMLDSNTMVIVQHTHTEIEDIVLPGLQQANGQRYECLDIPPCQEVNIVSTRSTKCLHSEF